MAKDFVFLTEKDEMWAKVLMEVLEDNNIPHVAFPVRGMGYCVRTGNGEHYKIHVPEEYLSAATDLVEQLFSGNFSEEEEA